MALHVLAKDGCMYDPQQANGLDERFRQTLQNMLVKYLDERKELWDQYRGV